MLVGPTQPPKTLNFVLLGVLAHFRIACAAATGRTIAQELLSSRSAINLADVNITFGIYSYHVRPVELARLATAASKTAQFRQVLPVDDIYCVIAEIGDVHAGLLRVGREVHRA